MFTKLALAFSLAFSTAACVTEAPTADDVAARQAFEAASPDEALVLDETPDAERTDITISCRRLKGGGWACCADGVDGNLPTCWFE